MTEHNELDMVKQKVIAQHRLGQSTMVLIKHMDSKFEALKELLIRKGVFTNDEFQQAVDTNIGLRLRSDDEMIEAGDIVWASYIGNIEGTKETFKEDLMPIRVGTGAVIFEAALIGMTPNTPDVKFTATFKKGPNAGKKINFTINIDKVKTGVANGRRELRELAGASESDLEAGGSGHEGGDLGGLQSV